MKAIPPLSAKDIVRFWNRVDIRSLDECWPWKAGKRNKDGYGGFGLGEYGNYRAHRIALYLKTGLDLPLLVCHTCDNPPCCNPAHLFYGTPQENATDKTTKKRVPCGSKHWTQLDSSHLVCARGSRHGRAKLTEDQVRMIRSSSDSERILAARYGVSNFVIHSIRTFKTWRHVV